MLRTLDRSLVAYGVQSFRLQQKTGVLTLDNNLISTLYTFSRAIPLGIGRAIHESRFNGYR